MKWIKPVLYVVLIAVAIWTLSGFVRSMRSVNTTAEKRLAEQQDVSSIIKEVTNSSAAISTSTATTTATNAAGEVSTNTPSLSASPATPTRGSQGNMVGYMFGFIGSIACLAVLFSKDINRWMADTAEELLLNDDVDKAKSPDYEHAEKVWADGRYLEAIGILRDFLKRNPREIYAAIRIAEIYESDLQNHLAAALEYEEVLKHKFSSEKWGWAAIHLVNIYTGKLDKHDEAVAWLKRIVTEAPTSSAAKKARERLASMDIVVDEPGAASASPVSETKPEPPSNLPKGFRPKQ